MVKAKLEILVLSPKIEGKQPICFSRFLGVKEVTDVDLETLCHWHCNMIKCIESIFTSI